MWWSKTVVTKTSEELDDMRAQIAAGYLPADAIERHFEAQARNVFGFDAKRRRDGSYIDQGLGSAINQTRNSLEAYKKYCSHEPDGSVDLQILGPDGSTWLAAPTAVHFTANGTIGPTYLPPGQYRVAIATTTAVYFSVAGVPLS
jgi:hypothetical protein